MGYKKRTSRGVKGARAKRNVKYWWVALSISAIIIALFIRNPHSDKEVQKSFDDWMGEIFSQEISSDEITANYMVKDREKYGITDVPILGHFSLGEMEGELMEKENNLAMLSKYPSSQLRKEQRVTKEIARWQWETCQMKRELLWYEEPLGPSTGLQAQVPTMLGEYKFDNEKDVEKYLKILSKLPEYFREIAAFEREKGKQGLFMEDQVADSIISQCQEVANPNNQYFVRTFKQRLERLELGAEKEKEYLAKNRDFVEKYVFGAYNELVKALKELKGSRQREAGLCHLPKGKAYYQYLLRAKTGSNQSISKVRKLLKRWLSGQKGKMGELLAQEGVLTAAQEAKYPGSNIHEQVEALQKGMHQIFPDMPRKVECQYKKVDTSMQESACPACYLTPRMDDFYHNVVYVNKKKGYNANKVFPTIAHETYPGHLYQNCYFLEQNPMPVRTIFGTSGYSEGWGTYSELYSFHLAGLPEEVANLLECNSLITLLLYGQLDIEVHYYGMSQRSAIAFLGDYGIDKISARQIYYSILQEPVTYLEYTLGYLEIEGLKSKAKKVWGEGYSEKRFHSFFLRFGPAPFAVIEKYI